VDQEVGDSNSPSGTSLFPFCTSWLRRIEFELMPDALTHGLTHSLCGIAGRAPSTAASRCVSPTRSPKLEAKVSAEKAVEPCEAARACTHKSRLVSSGLSMSALPPKADICQRIEHVGFVPIADIQPFIEAVNQPQELIRVLCARLPFRSELLPGGVLV